MKGTGFSPYIAEAKMVGLGSAENPCPRGLKADDLSGYMYGLKAVPFPTVIFARAVKPCGSRPNEIR
jgi:hypothetical protein